MATPPASGEFERDVVVIGGGGHVGLPLAIAFADRGARVAIYDVSESAVARVNAGKLPFDEPGPRRCSSAPWPPAGCRPRPTRPWSAPPSTWSWSSARPVDEHLNPNQTAIPKALGGCSPYLRDGQLLVLRSTVFPGVTALVEKMIVGPRGVDRGRVLPGADRRGQGDDRAVRAAADRLRALAGGDGPRGQAVLAC